MMNNDSNKQQSKFNNSTISSKNTPPKDLLVLVNNSNNSNQINNNINNKSVTSNDLKSNKFIFSDNSNTKTNINQNIISNSNSNNQNNINTNVSNISSLKAATEGLTPIKREQKNVKKMSIEDLMRDVSSPKVALEIKTKKENKLFLGMTIGSGVAFVIVLLIALLGKGNIINFSGNTVYYQNKVIENLGEYQTAVVTDNIYKNVTVKNSDDAKGLIIKDSNNQKAKCDNPKVKEVETRIEQNYGIVAVNLCELDYKFAKEIENVIKTVYKEFPNIKGYLTNLTLINAPEYSNYIASFVSAKFFASSNTFNKYPNVYKMSIFLNSSYFLNLEYFKSSIEDCLSYGYFPKNTTRYSLVAHEFGHYISFLAQLNNTKDIDSLLILTRKNYSTYAKLINDSNSGVFSLKIIEEAYNNYKKTNPNKFYDIDEFRASISEYAMAVDENGNYIYDETIAEAFHDYYINKNKSKPASREIVKVLKKYLNN